jgi:hypothetical protein
MAADGAVGDKDRSHRIRRRYRGNNGPSPAQLDLFAMTPASEGHGVDKRPPITVAPRREATPTQLPAFRHEAKPLSPRTQTRAASRTDPVWTVSAADLDRYSPEQRQQVDDDIARLPPGRLWFTYADVASVFGVSRATVVRKLRAGLVPGVRLQNNRMLDDGPVRRLSVEQVRYLLLAVRRSRV